MNDLDLMNIQVETLYRCDEQGRLLVVNEPDWKEPAPLFFLGRTATGNVWRYREDMPASLIEQIERICAAEPVVDDFAQPLQNFDALYSLLNACAPITKVWRGPAYLFPQPVTPPDGVVAINDGNRALVEPFFSWVSTLPVEYAPHARIVDGVAVALCFSSRLGDRACEAGLETAAAYRRRGYGAAATLGWASSVQQSGRLALYSTSWENHASQQVARSLGLHLYGEDISFS